MSEVATSDEQKADTVSNLVRYSGYTIWQS